MPQIGVQSSLHKVGNFWLPTGEGCIFTDRSCAALPCDTPIEPLVDVLFAELLHLFVKERNDCYRERWGRQPTGILTLKGGYPPNRCHGKLSFNWEDATTTCPVCGVIYKIVQSG